MPLATGALTTGALTQTGGPYRFVFLPGGGGGGEHDMMAFVGRLGYPIEIQPIPYPGWQRYVADDFSPAALVAELTADVVSKVPAGPIRIFGLSLGGHFGYAIALRLREMGREVAFFCAIDSFMVASANPSAGWQARAVSDALDLLKQRRFADLAIFVRSKAWRAVMRLAGGRLAGTLRRFSRVGDSPLLASDPVAQHELNLRLLIRGVAPWVAELDRAPAPLNVPAVLLRTRRTARDDAAWRRRCPGIVIREVAGKHLTLFEPENIAGLRDAFLDAARECSTET